MLKRKIERSGGYWFEIEPKQLKASQYDHCDNDFKKAGLNDRTKQVGGKLVQRDFYSSFLMHCSPDGVIHDRDICIREFTRFLKKQGMIVARILKTGDHTGNFGLKDFLKKKPAVS